MLFDSLILTAITRELNQGFAGAKIDRITQPSACDLLIRLHHRGTKETLLLSCDTEFARLHTTAIRRDNPVQPASFCMLLRKHLTGARLTAVTMPHGFGERIAHIAFQGYDGAVYILVAELMGKHSNIIFITGDGNILGAAKNISRDKNRHREIAPGIKYVLPPTQTGKRDILAVPNSNSPPVPTKGPHEVLTPVPNEGPHEILTPIPLLSKERLGEVLTSPSHIANGELDNADLAASWLVATYAGVSPFLAREVVLRTHKPYTNEALSESLRSIIQSVAAGPLNPIIWNNDRGVVQGAYPIRLAQILEADQYPRETMCIALDSAASSIQSTTVFERRRTALTNDLVRSKRQAAHERDEIERGLKNAARSDEYKECGDLLLSHYGTPIDGASITVPDFFAATIEQSEPPMRRIEIDPASTLQENAERYYKKARKARDSRNMLTERLAATRDRLLAVEMLETEIEKSTTETDLEKISGDFARIDPRSRLHPPTDSQTKSPARATPNFEGHKIKTFHSAEGWDILVGETATANDYLTTRVASPSDIWLHVRAATSAHGVIRTQNRPMSVPHATLIQAAQMVAARSQVKHSSLVPVDYTLKKYVRKPRKSAPGSVTYQNEKTLYVAGIGHGE